MLVNRRDFIRIAGVSFACACTGGLCAVGCSAKRTCEVPLASAGSYRLEGSQLLLALSEDDPLREVGGAVKIVSQLEDGSRLAVIVVHPADGEYRAFADRCTHNGKELDYLHERGELVCISRGSRFDISGEVIRGRAEGPLLRYAVWEEGSELVVDLQCS